MAFIFPGSKIQLVVGYIAALFFFLLNSRVRPFRDARVEKVHTFASLALAFSLFCPPPSPRPNMTLACSSHGQAMLMVMNDTLNDTLMMIRDIHERNIHDH
eukprot:233665-Rhodomonas_salina.1